MTSADIVIARFGGIRATARALRIHASSVLRWKRSGTVPIRRWNALLSAAQRNAVPLEVTDLLPNISVADNATRDTSAACNSATTSSTSSTGPVVLSPVIGEP
jgi:hypothetical protein